MFTCAAPQCPEGMYRKWKSQVDIVDVICHPEQWRIVTEDARYHNTLYRYCDFNIHQILPTLKYIVYKKDNVHYYLKIFHLNWNLHTLTLCVRWFKTFSHLHIWCVTACILIFQISLNFFVIPFLNHFAPSAYRCL